MTPTADPKTGALRVEENEALARLLRLNRQDVYSVEAWSDAAKAPSPELSEAKAILAETLKAKAEIAAMLKDVKGSAPKGKKKSEPEAA